MSVKGSRVVTDVPVLWSFPHVIEPHSINGGPMKYSVNLLFDKSSQVKSDIEAAIRNAYNEIEWNGSRVKSLTELKLPIRDGHTYRPNDEMYNDVVFVQATSLRKPGVIDKSGTVISSQKDVVGGCEGRASITLEAYKRGDEYVGIACRLNNLQKINNGKSACYVNDEISAADDFGVSVQLPF